MKELLKIRPYARLLTMLGDQLIKDERIALIELIKNAYDADATWVKVTFQNFDSNFRVKPDSKIIVQDDGVGMSKQVLSTKFLNPATPGKKLQKEINDKTLKGRIIQGEKGIGRFAMLKLGRKIDVISKTSQDENEFILHYDFSNYDVDFLTENNKEKELFIDDLSVHLEERKPTIIIPRSITLGHHLEEQKNQGTIIEISNLHDGWTEKKVKDVANDIIKMQSIFDSLADEEVTQTEKDPNSFSVYLYKDDDYLNFTEDYIKTLSDIIINKAVLKIENGYFNAEDLSFAFNLNGVPQKIFLTDPQLRGIKFTKNYFSEIIEKNLFQNRNIECGSFQFSFYIFDFSTDAPAKYLLDSNEKSKIRPHRIYLYRDGIRVYPYGEPEDDWLQIDTLRGTVSAGAFLSNDQVIGIVKISHKENPRLRDKTNREGLVEDGFATTDFIKLLQTFLVYVRSVPYKQYKINNEQRKTQRQIVEKQLTFNIQELKKIIKDNKKASEKLNEIEKEYLAEKQFLQKRAETTENLAGVGLSVETASHDIMQMLNLALSNLDNLISETMTHTSIDTNSLLKELHSLRGSLGFVQAQMKDIQLLFTSGKQRRRNIFVKEIVDKVVKIYRNLVQKKDVKIEIVEVPGSPLVAKTTDAVLLQVLLNLFDNAIYWLQTVDLTEKKIVVTLDGLECKMIFSDNGPGVRDDDLPYIFEPFYSGKGEEGRGLGLYIARQLLERSDYTIEYADLNMDKKLSGANFVINFLTEKGQFL